MPEQFPSEPLSGKLDEHDLQAANARDGLNVAGVVPESRFYPGPEDFVARLLGSQGPTPQLPSTSSHLSPLSSPLNSTALHWFQG